jgi:O-antigen/teichoic acid export membrane protein
MPIVLGNALRTITISRTHLLGWARKGSLAVLDQGLFSGANFLVPLVLARWLTPTDYGAFAVVYASYLMLAAFHTALLTEPMLVFGTGKYGCSFGRYLGLLLRAHVGMAVVFAIGLGLVALVLRGVASGSISAALLGITVAGPFQLLVWIVRGAFYVQGQPALAATGSGVYLLLCMLSLYGLWSVNALSVITALLAMGIAGLLSGGWLLVLLRFRLRDADGGPGLDQVLIDHWRYGRWSMVTAVLTWAPGSLYFAVVPAWVGLEGAAVLRALMNLVMPMTNASSALSPLLVPAFVRTRKQEGLSEARHPGGLAGLAFVLIAAGAAAYSLLLVLFHRPVVRWLYGGQYDVYAGLTLLVALIPLLSPAVVVFGSLLRARERQDLVFRAYLFATLTTLSLGLGLTAAVGTAGAVGGWVASYAVTAGALALFAVGVDARRA